MKTVIHLEAVLKYEDLITYWMFIHEACTKELQANYHHGAIVREAPSIYVEDHGCLTISAKIETTKSVLDYN